MPEPGPSTRAVHAGVPPAAQGTPILRGPVLAAPYHLSGAADAAPYGYARDANPTWDALEAALGTLEGGYAVVYPSGMAALGAAVGQLGGGDVLVAPHDAYPGIRRVAHEELAPRGVELRWVASDTEAVLAALPGATLVWIETPSNPGLDVVDLRAVGAAAGEHGARLAVDNTLATPLGQQPLALGADVSMCSGTKALTGHSDLLLGSLAVRDEGVAARLRGERSRRGAVIGPLEAWLAHRSLATLGLRLERQAASALALATALAARDDVGGVRYPGLPGDPAHAVAARQMASFGPVIGFDLGTEARAQAFLGACTLVAEATSFGGVHATAERRARWGTDAVGPGFVRFSCGIEDTADLVGDVGAALDATA